MAKAMSSVAGIVKPDGGFRVVVTELRRLRHHVQPGERLFVVPGLKVREPIPWGQKQADVIEKTQRYVLKQLAPENGCGECRQCCYTLHIPDLDKPSRQWCRECDQGVGCKTFWKAPPVCKSWDCSWRASQKTDNPMPAELRPDKSGVILRGPEEGDPEGTICIHPNIPSDAVNSCQMTAEMKARLDAQEAKGAKPRIITHYTGEKK
jgi:hypothetical protein